MMRIFLISIISLVMCWGISFAQTHQTVQLECGYEKLEIELPEGFKEISILPDEYEGCYFGYSYLGEDITLQGSIATIMWCHNCSMHLSEDCKMVTNDTLSLQGGNLYLCNSPICEQFRAAYYEYRLETGAFHISLMFPVERFDVLMHIISHIKHL